MDHRCHILYSRCSSLGISSNCLKAKMDRLVVRRINPKYFLEPQPMNECMCNVNEKCTHISEFSSVNFKQICVFPMPPIPYSRKDFLRRGSSCLILKKSLSSVR